MIRIEQPKSVVVHDGLDVSVVDGVVTVKPGPFLFGGLTRGLASSNQGQALGQSQSGFAAAAQSYQAQNIG